MELIRKEARIEEEEEEMLLASPGENVTGTHSEFERTMQQQRLLHDERLGSSSPEPTDTIPLTPRTTALGFNIGRRTSHTIEYSGNELSDMSETDVTRARGASSVSIPEEPLAVKPPAVVRPMLGARNVSQMSGFNVEQDPERVVWQGFLLYLKTKGGVRQWKDLWVVLRPKNITVYKNESEYSCSFIISMSSVINVVEIDPLSKTKRNCMQIITEEKSYKFCAHNEEMLDKSLGAFKSLLAKRKDHEGKRPAR